jgi:hypothetical protein
MEVLKERWVCVRSKVLQLLNTSKEWFSLNTHGFEEFCNSISANA